MPPRGKYGPTPGQYQEVGVVRRGQSRPWPPTSPRLRPGANGGLFADLQAEFHREVGRLSQLAAIQLGEPAGRGLETVELAICTAVTKLGGGLLERLLALDPDHRGPRVDCGGGHPATFSGYREKIVDTVCGPVHLRRAYYHCLACGRGCVPKDAELGVVGSSLSPGLRRMVAQVGSQEPFAAGSRDLAEPAGLHVTGKRVERSAEADGEQVRATLAQHAQAVITGTVVPLRTPERIPTLYLALDGTGVPTVPADTEGRAGKSLDGRAHTREVKLGCCCTQTTVDAKGRPGAGSRLLQLHRHAGGRRRLRRPALRRGPSARPRPRRAGDRARRWRAQLADAPSQAIQVSRPPEERALHFPAVLSMGVASGHISDHRLRIAAGQAGGASRPTGSDQTPRESP